MNRAKRLERSFAYHLAEGTWLPSAMLNVRKDLPSTARAAPAARQAVRDEVGELLGEEELEVVEVLISELVTNAVAHAGLDHDDSVVIHLAVASERLRVEVCDGGMGFSPRELGRRRHEPGGFGLLMVDRAASRWGVSGDDGSCVWFELDRQPA